MVNEKLMGMWSTRVMAVKMFYELVVGGGDVREWDPRVLVIGEVLPVHEVLIVLAELVAVKDRGNGVRGFSVSDVERVRSGMGVKVRRVGVRIKEGDMEDRMKMREV